MIVRTWSGRVPIGRADAFAGHLRDTGITDYRTQAGCHGAMLWRRDDGDEATFTLVSLWRDLEAIRAYAGDDCERAVLYDGDDAFGLVPDSIARHHDIVAISL